MLRDLQLTTNIVAPVSGTITARNDAVLTNPVLVNEAPYDGGWLVELATTDWSAESATLVSGEAVPAWAAAEAAKLEAETDAS